MNIRRLTLVLAALPALAILPLHLTRDVEPDVRLGGELSFEAKQALVGAIRRDHPDLQPIGWTFRAFEVDPEMHSVFTHVHPDLGPGRETFHWYRTGPHRAFLGGLAVMDGRPDGCRTLTIRLKSVDRDVAERATICPRLRAGLGQRWDVKGPVTRVPASRDARAATGKIAAASPSPALGAARTRS